MLNPLLCLLGYNITEDVTLGSIIIASPCDYNVTEL